MSLVTTRERPTDPYILLTPGNHPARVGPDFQQQFPDVLPTIHSIAVSRILAVDFETKGGDYSSDISIVGMGLAWDTGSCYVTRENVGNYDFDIIVKEILKHKGLIAHNVYFDGGVVTKIYGKHSKWNWHMCTYSLLAHLANEGVEGRHWGLKPAMTELLGWPSSNDTELDRWLVTNGWYNGNPRLDQSYEYLNAEYESGGLKPNKAEMWRAPTDILGKYCVLDAEACYLLYTKILEPVLMRFDGLQQCMRDTMYLIRVLIDQKISGIPVDRAGLESRREAILTEMVLLERRFRTHTDIAPYVEAIEAEMLAEYRSTEPEKYLKQKERQEPARWNKDGSESKNWIKWSQLEATPPVVSKNWEKWSQREPEHFNIQSADQLRTVLYTGLGHEVRVTTESGLPSTALKAIKHMGEPGKLLMDRMWLLKELGYMEKYLELTEHRDTIHPSFRTPGTVSGRLSSKEPNMQQIPKTKAVLSLFRTRPGKVWIDLDFSALEPVVAAEFTQDPNLLFLYGNGARRNDIYLFVGAQLPGSIGDRIRSTGYDPYNPTDESLAKAKRECKHERGICKTVVLACQYGAGVNKIIEILEQDDIVLDYEQVSQIHAGYWEVFAKVRDYGRALFYEWRRNRGYILNGMGRPMAIAEGMEKDALNRFIQSTGHDILVRYVRIYTQELEARGINYTPVVIDFHDASCIEVDEVDVNRASKIMCWGVDELNRQLAGSIQLRGEPDVGYDLADCKKPEE